MAIFILITFFTLVLMLSIVRVGVDAEFEDGKLRVRAKAAFMSFTVYPTRKERRKEKRRRKKKEPERKLDIHELVNTAIRVLIKLRRKVLIKRLTVVYIAGGADNPSSAAVAHGTLSAALGVTQEILETAFKVRNYELYANVNFNAREKSVYVRAALSLAVWELVYIAFGELSVKPKGGNAAGKETNKTVKHKSNANKSDK